MTEVQFNRSNEAAERAVRVRFLAFAIAIDVPFALLAGNAVLSLRTPPLNLDLTDLIAEILAIVVLSLFIGYLSGRAALLISVPKAIAVSSDRVVGDFRRSGWRGHPLKEIRFEDVREVRKTYLLRIPMIKGHTNLQRRKSIPDSALFYLSEANLEFVRLALVTFQRNQLLCSSERSGGVPNAGHGR